MYQLNLKRCDLFMLTVGYAQHIGKRNSQQDSIGVSKDGSFAVLADGMGGMNAGEVISGLVVKNFLNIVADFGPGIDIAALLQAVYWTNITTNYELTQKKFSQCGTTMVCSLVKNRKLLWASVGDSRIYLFRKGGLIQLNREHNLLHKQLLYATQGKLSFGTIGPKEDLDNLTSFFGMGNLAEVDFSVEPIELLDDDIVLLMSDGVYRYLTEQEISLELQMSKDPQIACNRILQKIIAKNHPYQDNASLVIQRL